MMVQARYSCSARMTRTSGCGKVSGDSDQRCSARARQSAESPSGPPTSSATSRPPAIQASSSPASASVLQARPRTSSATANAVLGVALSSRSPSSASNRSRSAGESCERCPGLLRPRPSALPRAAGSISTSVRAQLGGRRFAYSAKPSLTQLGMRRPTLRSWMRITVRYTADLD